ncbi:MAG: hypothetical protein AB8G15_09370 [Saprospiraceae bacterium]
MEVFKIVEQSLSNFFNTAASFLPTLVGALIILIIGWMIAKIVKWVILKLLKTLKFDQLTNRLGINDYLLKGGIKKTSSNLLASLVYWIIMLSILTAFFNTLGLEVVSTLLSSVILFLPKVIVACILLVVGMYLAEFVSGLVVGALKSGDVANAALFGNIAYSAVMFFVFSFVLHQLGIGQEIIETVIGIVLGALGLALALSFGLGGREWASNTINKYLGSGK